MTDQKTKRSRAKQRRRDSALSNPFATARAGRRPRYMVVFEKPSPDNVHLAMEVLDLRVVDKDSPKGVAVLRPRRRLEGSVGARIYYDLGIGALDMGDAELERLRATRGVRAVLPNQVRSAPPLRPSKSPARLRIGGRKLSIGELRAYLAGFSDASALIGELLIDYDNVLGAQKRIGEPTSALELIGIDENYSQYTGQGIKLAVLDSGLDLSHPDFVGRVIENVTAVSFVPTETVQDLNGHGTHCTGIAAGPIVSTGGPRYGVAPGVDLLIGKVLNEYAAGADDQIVDGINWAYQQGARIISMSIGSAREIDAPHSELYEEVASVLLNDGVLIVAGTGNDSSHPYYAAPVGDPAACPSIMAVAAVDDQEQQYELSNKQLDAIGNVDICAPGVDVYSSWPSATGTVWYATSGTSMATPHIAGVAALYLEQNPALTAVQLWQKLEANASPLGAAADFGAGLVQAP